MAATYTVKKGDNLWNIAKAQLSSGASNSEISKKVSELAKVNDLVNPDLIYPGQVLKLKADGSSTKKDDNQISVTIKQFGLQADVDNVLFITWTWSQASKTEEYEVRWDYYTKNKLWFGGVSSTTTTKDTFCTYSIPSNAVEVRVRVRAVPITTDANGNKIKAPFTCEWSEWKKHKVTTSVDTPSVPTVTLDGLKLTAELENLDADLEMIQFEVVKDNTTTVKKEKVGISTSVASYTCDVLAGGTYKVRARAYKDNVWSEWSDYSSNSETIPATPTGFTKCEPSSGTSILLEWSAISNATSYDIEYTTKKSNFDGSDQVSSKTGITTTTYEISSGIESGKEYFFRLRAVNAKGNSGWSEVKSTIIGEPPSPPTTWSSTTTVIAGEPLTLYWVHNSEDGSAQSKAHLEVYVDNVLTIDKEITYSEDEKTTSSYVIDTSGYVEGVQLRWRVQTCGIDNNYSDFSTERVVDVYAPPIVVLTLTNSQGETFDVLESFPFKVSALAGPNTQRPIGYYVEITANEYYDTVDNIGNSKTVNPGDRVYSKYFDISEKLEIELSAGDMCLENNMSYTVTCTVSMNSGLTAKSTAEFTVTWEKKTYIPNASIGIDEDTLTAFISPYCATYSTVYYKVTRKAANNTYVTDKSTVISYVYGTVVNGAVTTTGDRVYVGTTGEGVNTYYCIIEDVVRAEDVFMSVYRREFDGSFTLLASGLDGTKSTSVTDPHPALDYARYRIVAISKTTGAVTYYDLPGYPVGGKSIVIQWDEQWSKFDSYGSEDDLEQPPWSGSMLKLPYNIDVSNKHSPDVSLVEYIGRKHPVSYYGTQLGETASWNVVIEKSDVDTLYALRRLAVWMGNVYVREPSGSGYWANIKVSFNQKHCDLTIPVSIEVTRVEGGA